jgi:hypothetical protein
MLKELSLEHLVKRIKESFGEFCDARTGQNTQYDMVDAGMGAFWYSVPKVLLFWGIKKT